MDAKSTQARQNVQQGISGRQSAAAAQGEAAAHLENIALGLSGFFPPEARKTAKLALCAFSFVLSIVGLLLAIAAFFAANAVLSLMQQATSAQLDGIILAMADVQNGVSYVADSLGSASSSISSVSSSFRDYAAFSSSTADSLESLSSSLSLLSSFSDAPVSFSDSAQKLRSAGNGFLAAADGVNSTGSSLSSASTSARLLASDMGTIRDNLSDAKEKTGQAIGLLRIAFLLFTLVLLFLFSSVAASSLAGML